MIALQEARERMLQAVSPITATENLAPRTAFGRVLSATVRSPIDIPPFPNSSMDGYAFAHPASETMQVVGVSAAGRPYRGSVQADEAIRIFTGAMIPEGADTVAPQEIVKVVDQHRIQLPQPPSRGANFRQAGMDLHRGDVLAQAGDRLNAGLVGLLAGAGLTEVSCLRKLRLALFATGDELRLAGQRLDPGAIYESNLAMLSVLTDSPCMHKFHTEILPDSPDRIGAALADAAQNTDAIIVSGGMSVGDADFAIKILLEKGQLDFWKIALKPGKPFAFGTLGGSRFFGLPGNPVSTVVGFTELVAPCLDKMSGARPRKPVRVPARLTGNIEKEPGRMEFQRGRLHADASKQLTVEVTGDQSSNRLGSLAHANCYIVLDKEQGDLKHGADVLVQPFESYY